MLACSQEAVCLLWDYVTPCANLPWDLCPTQNHLLLFNGSHLCSSISKRTFRPSNIWKQRGVIVSTVAHAEVAILSSWEIPRQPQCPSLLSGGLHIKPTNHPNKDYKIPEGVLLLRRQAPSSRWCLGQSCWGRERGSGGGRRGRSRPGWVDVTFSVFWIFLWFSIWLFPKYIWQPWMVVRNAASVVKGEEDFVSLHISNLPECFPNRGNSEENMHWVRTRDLWSGSKSFPPWSQVFPPGGLVHAGKCWVGGSKGILHHNDCWLVFSILSGESPLVMAFTCMQTSINTRWCYLQLLQPGGLTCIHFGSTVTCCGFRAICRVLHFLVILSSFFGVFSWSNISSKCKQSQARKVLVCKPVTNMRYGHT